MRGFWEYSRVPCQLWIGAEAHAVACLTNSATATDISAIPFLVEASLVTTSVKGDSGVNTLDAVASERVPLDQQGVVVGVDGHTHTVHMASM